MKATNIKIYNMRPVITYEAETLVKRKITRMMYRGTKTNGEQKIKRNAEIENLLENGVEKYIVLESREKHY